MLALKPMLVATATMFVIASAGAVLNIFASRGRGGLMDMEQVAPAESQNHWRTSLALLLVAWTPMLIALSIAVTRR